MTKAKQKASCKYAPLAPHGRSLLPKFRQDSPSSLFLFKYNRWRFIAALIMTMLSSALMVAINSMLSPVIDAVAVKQDMDEFVKSLVTMGIWWFSLVAQYLGSLGMTIVASEQRIQSAKLFEKCSPANSVFRQARARRSDELVYKRHDMLNMALSK